MTTRRPRVPEPAASRRPRSTTRHDLIEQEIMVEATRLFAEKGFSGTSLQDIADATGLTRPALYHYIKSKNDVLAKLVAELAQGPAEQMQRIRAIPDLGPAERLREMAYVTSLAHAQDPARFQLLIRSEAYLPDDLIGPYRESRREVLREVTAVIEEGIRAGQFRPVDSRIAALSILGQCNWVAWWHRPSRDVDEKSVAAAVADLAVASVLAEDAGEVNGDPVAGAMKALRQDLQALEHALAATPSPAPGKNTKRAARKRPTGRSATR